MATNVINVLDTDTLVAGTSGADSIVSNGYYVTINAGTGNDTVNLSGGNGSEKILYTNGDGNDIIIRNSGFMPIALERLALAEGTSISSYSVSGKDHIFKIGSGSVTFKNADILGWKAAFTIPTFSTVAADNELGYEYKFTYDNKIYFGGKIFNYDVTYNSNEDYWIYKATGTADADYISWGFGFDGNSTIVDGGAGDKWEVILTIALFLVVPAMILSTATSHTLSLTVARAMTFSRLSMGSTRTTVLMKRIYSLKVARAMTLLKLRLIPSSINQIPQITRISTVAR